MSAREERPEKSLDENLQDDPIVYPIDGILDLHQFNHRELDELISAYLEACLERGLLHVRIIHGKGIGVQRERVHAMLRTIPSVEDFRLDSGSSSWGATLVDLKPSEKERKN